MFWGLKVEPEKRYTQTVVDAFHISQAALDLLSVKDDTSPVQVMVEYESTSHLLASLSKAAKIYQVHLDLNFEKGDRVSFFTVGPGTVHLTGYHVIDDEDMEDRLMQAHGLDEESDELEDEEETENSSFDDSVGVLGKRKKALQAISAGKGKKSKLDSSDDDDDENDDFGSTLGDSTLLELEAGESDDDDDEFGEEEEEEEDEDSEELDSDAEEDESPKKPVTNGNTPNKKGKGAAKTPETKPKGKKELNQSQQQTPKPGKTPKGEKTPKTTEKTPKSEKKTPKQDGATPKQEKGKKTPVGGSPQKKVLQGGVVAEELKTGDGALAKSGKMVQVYYVGRLKSNNKQFDAATGGPGFKFRLGRAEVIRGWDVGVEGMRVGGKRRLTIPAAQAYGSKGSPPVIPPNSTLVFDVELRNVS